MKRLKAYPKECHSLHRNPCGWGSSDPTKSFGAWPPFLCLETPQWVALSFVLLFSGFQESRRFQNDSSCGLRFPRAPKGPSVLTDTLSLTSSGMCIVDTIEHVSNLILCFIASSVSIWAQALWIFFALVAPPLAHDGEADRELRPD